jgi:preprotein translocase subunit YajC
VWEPAEEHPMKELLITYFPVIIFAVLFPIFLIRELRRAKRKRDAQDQDPPQH